MTRFLLAALIAVVLATAPAAAQRRTEVPAGSRVRLSVLLFVDGRAVRGATNVVTGTLVAVDSFAVTTRVDGDSALLSVPLTSITQMQVSRGRASAAQGGRRGLRIGALTGGGFAAGTYGFLYLLRAVTKGVRNEPCESEFFNCPRLPHMIPVIAAGTVGGGLVGFALGSREQERWQSVRPRSLAPGELTLTVTLHR